MARLDYRSSLARTDAAARGLPVFIVDDDEATCHALLASLEALGCKAEAFASCEAFLAASERVGRGCLLLDYHFANMSGLDLLDRLREIDRVLPTVLFSGRFGPVLRKRSIDYPEIVTVLAKPLSGRSVLDALLRARAASSLVTLGFA